MIRIKELEKTLLDQIEKLNDDSLFEDKEKAMVVVERSKAISGLTANYVEMQRVKLDVVRELNRSGKCGYEDYLGIEDEKNA